MQSQIQYRQALIGILMVLIASVAFSSKAIMVKLTMFIQSMHPH